MIRLSRKRIFDVVMFVLSAIFMVVKTVTDKYRLPEIDDETK